MISVRPNRRDGQRSRQMHRGRRTPQLGHLANFTEGGHDRNVEAGVFIDDPVFGRGLVEQWRSAIAAGVFVPVDVVV
jgi:hypothetical protein